MKIGPLRPHEQMLSDAPSKSLVSVVTLKVNINRMYHFKAIVSHHLYWDVTYDNLIVRSISEKIPLPAFL